MTVYLAYAAEYMDMPVLIGVYANEVRAIVDATAKAQELDDRQHDIFDGDEDWKFIPATWFVQSREVIE